MAEETAVTNLPFISLNPSTARHIEQHRQPGTSEQRFIRPEKDKGMVSPPLRVEAGSAWRRPGFQFQGSNLSMWFGGVRDDSVEHFGQPGLRVHQGSYEG